MGPSSRHAIPAGLALAVLLAALYLIPSARLGFWEPWETSLATLGRFVATTDGVSPFAPMRDGALLGRPWLETFLLSLGYRIGGGSEFGFRLPLALLMITAAMSGFVVFQRFFGTLRAFCVGALFGVAPVILLASTNLAGHAAYEAPVVITFMLACAILGGWDRVRPAATVLMGPALALCFWAGGVLGLAVPVAAIALFSVGARIPERKPAVVPLAVGLGITALGVVGPLLVFLEMGWGASKDVIGVCAALGVPLGILIAALPGSQARVLFHKVYTPIAAVLFCLLVGMPFATLVEAAGSVSEAIPYVLYTDFLSGRVLPEHVTFDVLIRLVGASAFPTVMLVPFGFAYLFRSFDGPDSETDDPSEGARSIKQLLTIWMITGFLVFGLGASLAGSYAFPLGFPMTAAVGLALGDRRFRDMLSRNLFTLYMAGLTGMMLLGMTSKDVRGAFNEDSGRPGPHVVFERLLTDGAVEFPPTYTFAHMKFFMLAWALVLVLTFGAPVMNLGRIGHMMHNAFAEPGSGLVGKVLGLFRRVLRPIGGLLLRVHDVLTGRLGVWHVASASVVMFTFAAASWGVHLAYVDVPDVTDHLSQKGLMDTFDRLNVEDGPLYVAGIDSNDNSYYLGEGRIERLNRIADLRGLFCEHEDRVFAVIPFDKLADAHFAVKSVRDGDECAEGLPFFVVDGRSSRYVLLSNQLDEAAGERDESVIAENVFTRETLPEGVELTDDEILVGGNTLRYVGHEMIDAIDSGEFTVTTYWEVIERPAANYEMFIHVDLGGNRLNGDHDPVHGYYPMRNWVPGEIVRDQFDIDVSRADPSGTYHVYLGFFRGDDRLEVVGSASQNRVLVDTIEVE